MTDAGAALHRALAAALGPAARIEVAESRPWASVTFSGERHRVLVRLEDCGIADSFLDGLGERDFALRGHILADIALAADARGAEGVRLTLEALTVAMD